MECDRAAVETGRVIMDDRERAEKKKSHIVQFTSLEKENMGRGDPENPHTV